MSALPDLSALDRLVHEPARLGIVATLAVVREADFVFLRRQTGLTAGNLSSHLTKLEDAGYVRVDKQFLGRRPQTTCALTPEGRAAFTAWRGAMRALLDAFGD